MAEHPSAPRASDGTVYKYVTRASQDASRLIQVGVPIESSAGNLLYSVYQQQADILVRSRNLQALWIVNLESELAVAALFGSRLLTPPGWWKPENNPIPAPWDR